MRHCALALFLVCSLYGRSQQWQAELMAAAANYNGDLTEKAFNLKTIRPAVGVNVKYEFYYLVVRAGVSYTRLGGDDKNNKDIYLHHRNLNFKTDIWEASLCAELNLYEPDIFWAYPYIFGGVGLYRFNPYTYDDDGKKTYLQPLRTEAQGLPGGPKDSKPYKLTQFCLPVGAGWKFKLNDKFDLACEFGYRILFTDYLDDVSTVYANPVTLTTRVGPKSAELAMRATPAPIRPNVNYLPKPGDQRGNPGIKDSYYFSSVKLIMRFGKTE